MLRLAKRFDVFRILQDRERHLTPPTTEGAIVSIITLALMLILILFETSAFFQPDIRTSMFVDSNEHKKETVHFNVSFPQLPCHHMVVEVFDPQTGMTIPELSQTIRYSLSRILSDSPSIVVGEYPLNSGVIPFGDHASRREGCRVAGTLHIDKVPGNFYIAGQRNMGPNMPPSDHLIHEFWIGDERLDYVHDHIPESLANALGGVGHQKEDPAHTLYQYFLQVVPTYFERNGKTTKIGYQYTATFSKAMGPEHIPPGVYFRHQHAPLAVEYRYEYQTWSHFLVHVCAVIGGVYVVMGFVAGFLEIGSKKIAPVIQRKMKR